MTLETLAYRIVTDLKFASQLQKDPETVIQEEGIELSEEEYQALLIFLAKNHQRNLTSLDLDSGPLGENWSD